MHREILGQQLSTIINNLPEKDYYQSRTGSEFGGVEKDGDRTIVDEINLHVSTETAGFNGESVGRAERLVEIVVQR